MSVAHEFDTRQAVKVLSKCDPQLAAVMRRAGPFRLEPIAMHNPFESLLRAIVYQQLSGKAAGTIYARVEALLPKRRSPRAEDFLHVDDELLRGAGMSRAKVAAAKDLAAKTVEGVVPTAARLRRMSDEEIVERLVSIRGVGVWTVEMLLIRMGRPDVLPISDLGVRKGFQLTYGHPELPVPRAVQDYGERWRPFRTVASWYLWRAVEIMPFDGVKKSKPKRVKRSTS